MAPVDDVWSRGLYSVLCDVFRTHQTVYIVPVLEVWRKANVLFAYSVLVTSLPAVGSARLVSRRISKIETASDCVTESARCSLSVGSTNTCSCIQSWVFCISEVS